MEFLSDSNADKLRYKWEERKEGHDFAYFYVGENLMKKAHFFIRNHYSIIRIDKKILRIENNLYGNALTRLSSSTSQRPYTFSRLAFPKRIIEAYDLPKIDKIIILPFEIHTFEDSNKNYISFTFG